MRFDNGDMIHVREVTLQEAYLELKRGNQIVIEDGDGTQMIKESKFGLITIELAAKGTFYVLDRKYNGGA